MIIALKIIQLCNIMGGGYYREPMQYGRVMTLSLTGHCYFVAWHSFLALDTCYVTQITNYYLVCSHHVIRKFD